MTEKLLDLIRIVENRVHPEQNTIGIDLTEEKGLKLFVMMSICD